MSAEFEWLRAKLCTDVIDARKRLMSHLVNHFRGRMVEFNCVETAEDPDKGPIWTFELVVKSSELELSTVCRVLSLDFVCSESVVPRL